MRGTRKTLGAFASLTLILAVPPLARAQVPEPTPAPGTRFAKEATVGPEAANVAAASAPAAAISPIIGSHQIDRYDALEKERKAVEANPKSLADWIILGELAHEVAMDAPASTAGKYFEISRRAFEQGLRLAPNNAGLKAAVQFAKDQEQNADRFEKSRDEYTDTFLTARRRDLVATGNTPYVKIYEPPLPSRTLPGPVPPPATPPTSTAATNGSPPPATPAAAAATVRATTDPAVNSAAPLVRSNSTPVAEASPAVTPAAPNAPATDAANFGTQQNYSFGPRYLPFVNQEGVPYTYQQYNNAYFPAGIYNNPAVVPVTPQRVYSGVVVPNAFERQILNRAAPTPIP